MKPPPLSNEVELLIKEWFDLVSVECEGCELVWGEGQNDIGEVWHARPHALATQ